jgi:ribosomal protein S6--L-glutamate ligase
MILSFHPCFVGDRNIICAGRPPGDEDLKAIRRAKAVILPQGCSRALHDMARHHCAHVFPDYRCRFDFPGKIGQARLFRSYGVDHPATICFSDAAALDADHPDWRNATPMAVPFVFKFDWGGEGDAVFYVETPADLAGLVARSASSEVAEHAGFVIQAYIPSRSRTLRVAVIGTHTVAYWRVQDGAGRFQASLAKGGRIDAASDPHLQEMAVSAVRGFCRKSGVNLAGFDLLFPDGADPPRPLFLEINWFFGRRGLGGSERYYALLTREISRWLKTIGPTI